MNESILANYPQNNPVFVAADNRSFDFIRRLNGVCFFGVNFEEEDKFLFCFQREFWVVYSHVKYFSFAMELAHMLQSKGANKILVFLLSDIHFIH